MYREEHIAHENASHWVLDHPSNHAFEVYRKTATHSERCAIIGRSLGLQRAIDEADNRARLHHIVAINEKTGRKDYLTRYPMAHDACCVMMRKQSKPRKHVRIQLEPFSGY